MKDSSVLDPKPADQMAGYCTPDAQSPHGAPTFLPATKDECDHERRATLKRAMKIGGSLGWMLACSYLIARGWSVEDACQALAADAPRKARVRSA
jgi:hypothetical protein